jgi:hypothetical protein
MVRGSAGNWNSHTGVVIAHAEIWIGTRYRVLFETSISPKKFAVSISRVCTQASDQFTSARGSLIQNCLGALAIGYQCGRIYGLGEMMSIMMNVGELSMDPWPHIGVGKIHWCAATLDLSLITINALGARCQGEEHKFPPQSFQRFLNPFLILL